MSENDFWLMMSDEYQKPLPKASENSSEPEVIKKVSKESTTAAKDDGNVEFHKQQDPNAKKS